MKSTSLIVIATALAAFSPEALAQIPASRVLTFELAQSMAQEAMTKCRADGFKVTVVVVDSLNALKVVLRDNGATAATTEVARMKATSVMLYDRPSGPRADLPAGAPVPAPTIPGTIIALGGVPIKLGDSVIGALAVSGAPQGEKDLVCANAGLAKFTPNVK